MKRWFTQWVHKKIEEKIGFAIGAIIGIVVGITLFVSCDKTPATAADYEPLEQQMTAVQQNPELLLKTNCNISISDDIMTVSFSNDECTLTVKYNKDFEVLSTSKEDNCIFWPFALVSSVFIGFFLYEVAYCLLPFMLGFICDMLKLIKYKEV